MPILWHNAASGMVLYMSSRTFVVNMKCFIHSFQGGVSGREVGRRDSCTNEWTVLAASPGMYATVCTFRAFAIMHNMGLYEHKLCTSSMMINAHITSMCCKQNSMHFMAGIQCSANRIWVTRGISGASGMQEPIVIPYHVTSIPLCRITVYC